MSILFKTIFWISISFIGSSIVLSLLVSVLPLESNNDNINSIFLLIRLYGIPIAVLLTLTGTVKAKDKLVSVLAIIFATIGFSLLSLIIMVFVFAGSVCNWVTDDILYQNKANPSVIIESRHYDCGATDSGKSKIQTYKIVKLNEDFIWRTRIDTNSINQDEWIRIPSSSQ